MKTVSYFCLIIIIFCFKIIFIINWWVCDPWWVTAIHDHLSPAALAADRPESRLEVVFAGPQVICWSSPTYISDMLMHGRSGRSVTGYTARRLEHYIVPRTNSRFGVRAFFTSAPRAWDQLPVHLKTASCSTDLFKRRLKTFLFNSPCLLRLTVDTSV